MLSVSLNFVYVLCVCIVLLFILSCVCVLCCYFCTCVCHLCVCHSFIRECVSFMCMCHKRSVWVNCMSVSFNCVCECVAMGDIEGGMCIVMCVSLVCVWCPRISGEFGVGCGDVHVEVVVGVAVKAGWGVSGMCEGTAQMSGGVVSGVLGAAARVVPCQV